MLIAPAKIGAALLSLFFAGGASILSHQAAEDPVPQTRSIDHHVADEGATCEEGSNGSSDSYLRRSQYICVEKRPGAELTPIGLSVFDDDDQWYRLRVPSDFAWSLTESSFPEVGFEATIEGVGRRVVYQLIPDVAIETSFDVLAIDQDVPPSPAGPQVVESDASLNGQAVDGASQAGEPDAAPPATDSAMVTIGASPVTKVITLTGLDRGLDGLVIRDEVPPELLVATQDGSVPPTYGDGTIELRPRAGAVSYELALAESPAAGARVFDQQTRVLFNGVPLSSTTSRIGLDIPSLSLTVDALPEVIGGGYVSVELVVRNLLDGNADGPLELRLKPKSNGSVLDTMTSKDGAVDGAGEHELVWSLPPLAGGEEAKYFVQSKLRLAKAGGSIDWEASLHRAGADEPIQATSATTEVLSSGSSTADGVDFEAGQLLLLVAGVVVAALIALLIAFCGWWYCGRNREPEVKADEKAREHQLERFRAFAEAVLVLVILVAILVLALKGSLSGESAASLIGVIAGYALGRSRSGK